MIREARSGVKKRLGVGAVAFIAMASLFVGYAFAANGFLPTPVTQKGAYDSGQTTTPTDWPIAPTLNISSVPTGTSSCSGNTLTGPSAQQLIVAVFNATGGTTVCKSGDFAEEWVYSSASTSNAIVGTDTFVLTATSNDGSGSVTGTATLKVSMQAGVAWTLILLEDFGTPAMPTSGISLLSVSVDGT